MNQFLRAATVALVLVSGTALFAQRPEEEPSRAFEILSREGNEWFVPKNTITFGFRVLASGAKINFSNLGSVASIRSIAAPGNGAVDRYYDNGYVRVDVARTNEKDANGLQTSTPGGRYQTFYTDASGVTSQTGDYLSFTPGLTREWSYSYANQLDRAGYVSMSSYSAVSEGASVKKEQGMTSGVDLQMNRIIFRTGRRLEWSLAAGVAINDIGSKASGSVKSTLNTLTDYYNLNGVTVPAATYAASSFTDLLNPDGSTAVVGGYESTKPISQNPAASETSSVAGGATVKGNWKIKGAYFMLRVGPSIRAQLSERLGLSASAGIAGAYAGSRYSVVETLDMTNVLAEISTTEESSESKFLSGFYADVNLEWIANERTGLFGGLSMQQFGSYQQAVGGRFATIDLGSTIGLRGGISFRF